MAKQQMRGYITMVQEQRFRLINEDGRSFLFTLDRKAPIQIADLEFLKRSHAFLLVGYTGEPNRACGVVDSLRAIGRSHPAQDANSV